MLAPKDFVAKMPFVVSPEIQILSKILDFANLLPLEYDYKSTFIETFSPNCHVVAKSVESL